MPNIEPKILKGFRDFLPQQQIARQQLIDRIKKTYELFGFSPLETPAMEYSEILLGKYGDEGDKLMYRFKDNGDRDVALRYDLTIPLARVVAQYPELPKPFKRYQVAPVWRAENPQKGRFREFYQCDIDIAGTENMLADAEVINVMYQTLLNLGVTDFTIRVNNRKILNGFFSDLKTAPEQQVAIMRAIDKAEKIGATGVREELQQIGLSETEIAKVIEFTQLEIKQLADLEALRNKFPATSEGVDELQQTLSYVQSLIDQPQKVQVDLAIARGLDYYTGNVFETRLNALPQYGSVFSGGRYDKLVGIFSNKEVPAVGASIGIDRLFAALTELNVLPTKKSTAQILIVNFDVSLINNYLQLASLLRQNNFNTILYYENIGAGKQIKFAVENEIDYALILGPDEKKNGQISVKTLKENKQETIALDQLLNYLKK